MAIGSFFSNLFQKKPEDQAQPEGSARSARDAAPESEDATARRRMAVDLAVSEGMTAAGVDPAHYKHRSRRADANALRMHVMIDLARELSDVPVNLLSQVGASITQRAKAKGDTEIAAVYWRLDSAAAAPASANIVRQAIANKIDAGLAPAAAPAAAPASPAVSATAPAAKAATSEKIAKLRAMMGDSAPAGANEPAYEKTQVSATKGASESYEKTQVLKVSSFQATEVFEDSKHKDDGKVGKP